ncbi:MAG: hypothetical protein ACQ9MH_14305 [Nitrospinales bacterium]
MAEIRMRQAVDTPSLHKISQLRYPSFDYQCLGALQVSQSRSDDNWVQKALDESGDDEFPMTPEELRDWKKFKRRGYAEFADAYREYLQLEKKEGGVDFTLKEFCARQDIKYPLSK